MYYGNMGIKRSGLIRQSDLRGLQSLSKKKFLEKKPKTKIAIFPFVFWATSFVKSKAVFANLNLVK